MTESTAIVRRGAGGDLATQEFTAAQVGVIKAALMPRATDAELAVFIEYAKRTGLDPFSRQIYAIPKKTQTGGHAGYEFMTGIDGLRLIAERTGEYEGSEVEWCGADGKWTDVWLEDRAAPSAARVTVFRSGRPARKIVVRWKEFCRVDRQGHPMGAWKTHPAHQLGIAAERHALRRVFPRETAGIYVDIEGDGSARPQIREPDSPASTRQKGRLHQIAAERGWDDDERHRRAGVKSFNDLTRGAASLLIDAWTNDDDDVIEGEVVDEDAADDVASPEAAPSGQPDPETKPAARSKGKGTKPSTSHPKNPPDQTDQAAEAEAGAVVTETEVGTTAPATADGRPPEPPDHPYRGDGDEPCVAVFDDIRCGYDVRSPIHRAGAGGQGTLA